MRLLYLFAAAFFATGQIYSQTIAEKRAGIGSPREDLTEEMKAFLLQINSEVNELQAELKKLYEQTEELYKDNAPEECYRNLLQEINEIKSRIQNLQQQWQQLAASNSKEAEYALWNQPDTTIGQLVNDFGSHNYLYVAPPEISAMRISLDSNLPIPRSSWDEILSILLHQSGIGIRQLNPYLRQLYVLRQDLSNLRIITAKRQDLDFFPPTERIIFLLTPDPSEVKRVWYFMDKFANSNTTTLEMVGRDILIVGKVSEIQDLLKIYDFVSTHRGDKEYKAIRVHKVDVVEMAEVLSALFESITEESLEGAPAQSPGAMARDGRDQKGLNEPARQDARRSGGNSPGRGGSSLKIIALQNIAQAIFLVGTKEEIRKAEEIVQQVEAQVGETRRKKIVWYHVKHSDPEELAQVLAKIYDLMIMTGTGGPEDEPFLTPMSAVEQQMQRNAQVRNDVVEAVASLPKIPLGVVNDTGFLSSANFLVNPEDVRLPRPPPNQGRDNFLVDPKTGSLIMVIEADLVAEMTNLIKKLDVPKRMVQIEVMLVEQVIHHNTDIGLNLLKIGSCASQCNDTCFSFRNIPTPDNPIPGITDFLVSRAKNAGIPAYDIAYHFLMSRDDVRVSACPSVLTMNETEATIKIEEEISVSVGTFIVPNSGSPTLEQSYARGIYGISINVVPTIHMHDPDCPFDDGVDYITLDSDVKFETITSDLNDRPNVLRRILKNQARIADGQTVIIGGFRRKDAQDTITSVPFLGEIPGFGKLFSNTSLEDRTIETFLFLTAKIASQPLDDLESIKMAEMAKRPGDLPYFMKELRDAISAQEDQYLYQTMEMLFGREPDRYVDKEACEYNGR